jgi:PadR family transcriptional regulator PadR
LHSVAKMLRLGGFEYLVLSSAARLGDDAYGAAVRKDIVRSTRRSCSLSALDTTLDRLEAKGLIDTWMGDPTPRRGSVVFHDLNVDVPDRVMLA